MLQCSTRFLKFAIFSNFRRKMILLLKYFYFFFSGKQSKQKTTQVAGSRAVDFRIFRRITGQLKQLIFYNSENLWKTSVNLKLADSTKLFWTREIKSDQLRCGWIGLRQSFQHGKRLLYTKRRSHSPTASSVFLLFIKSHSNWQAFAKRHTSYLIVTSPHITSPFPLNNSKGLLL